jgi:hypothetical protein
MLPGCAGSQKQETDLRDDKREQELQVTLDAEYLSDGGAEELPWPR